MQPIEMGTVVEKYLSQYCPAWLYNSANIGQETFNRFHPLIMAKVQKWLSNNLTPFNLCPRSIVFWFLVPPFSAIGVAILGLRTVVIYWRQQIEPNETVYIMFKLAELKTPFPLTLLVMFAALGLVIADAAFRVLSAVRAEFEQRLKRIEEEIEGLSDASSDLKQLINKTISEEKQQNLIRLLEPFNLTPRMSIYFPVYNNHTSLGFLTIDFRHIEFSLKQSLEPNETVLALIRFLDLYSPFPLQVGVMLLTVGLFLTGLIHEFNQESRQEVISEVKRVLNKK